MKKHVFFVSSNFHLTICLGIINEKQISKNDVIFVNSRGCSFPEDLKSNVVNINGSDSFHFKQKLIESLKRSNNIDVFNDNIQFTAYVPFFRQIPYGFFKDLVFFEEGFSSYSDSLKFSLSFRIIQSTKSFIKSTIVNFLLFGKPDNLKNFVKGPLYSYRKFNSNKRFEYYTLSENVARSSFLNFDIKVLSILPKYLCEDIKHSSLVLVLDRFTAPIPYSISNYIIYIKKILATYGDRFIYVKFHPADFTNTNSRSIIDDLFNSENINYCVIERSLEELALSNRNITFIGTNSTLLFYAPKFGNNNSISFVKYLSSIDKGYYEFLYMWGGVNKFVDVFKENVEIYEL